MLGWTWTAEVPNEERGTDIGSGYRSPNRLVGRYHLDEEEPDREVIFSINTDGSARCTSVTVTAQPNGRQVLASDLQIALADMAEDNIARLALATTVTKHDGYDVVHYKFRDPTITPPREARAAARASVSRGQRRTSDATLQRVADAYRAALKLGNAPTKAVAEELGSSHRTAGDHISRARSRGFLMPSLGPGKAGERSKDQ
jgi:hypothetical protein